MKNNQPACILLSVKKYEKIVETSDDYKLLIEAQSKLLNAKEED